MSDKPFIFIEILVECARLNWVRTQLAGQFAHFAIGLPNAQTLRRDFRFTGQREGDPGSPSPGTQPRTSNLEPRTDLRDSPPRPT
jgi:hypothetical protein